jgi:hypothetical protein
MMVEVVGRVMHGVPCKLARHIINCTSYSRCLDAASDMLSSRQPRKMIFPHVLALKWLIHGRTIHSGYTGHLEDSPQQPQKEVLTTCTYPSNRLIQDAHKRPCHTGLTL